MLEARDRFGGTWDLFRYPGVRSDSSMATYAYDFAPWTAPTALAEGADILAYLEATARSYGVDERVRLGHRVVRAAWSSDEVRWRVTVAHDGGESVVVCRFLWVCTGYYRYDRGHAPALAGREEFGGRLAPPAGLAGRPGRRRARRGRDRQRGHRGDAGPGPRRARCAGDDGPAFAELRGVGAAARGGPVRAGPGGRDPDRALRAQPTVPRPGALLAPARRRPAAPGRLRRRDALHARVRPLGPAALRQPGGRPVRRDRVGTGARSSPARWNASPPGGCGRRRGRRCPPTSS